MRYNWLAVLSPFLVVSVIGIVSFATGFGFAFLVMLAKSICCSVVVIGTVVVGHSVWTRDEFALRYGSRPSHALPFLRSRVGRRVNHVNR